MLNINQCQLTSGALCFLHLSYIKGSKWKEDQQIRKKIWTYYQLCKPNSQSSSYRDWMAPRNRLSNHSLGTPSTNKIPQWTCSLLVDKELDKGLKLDGNVKRHPEQAPGNSLLLVLSVVSFRGHLSQSSDSYLCILFSSSPLSLCP